MDDDTPRLYQVTEDEWRELMYSLNRIEWRVRDLRNMLDLGVSLMRAAMGISDERRLGVDRLAGCTRSRARLSQGLRWTRQNASSSRSAPCFSRRLRGACPPGFLPHAKRLEGATATHRRGLFGVPAPQSAWSLRG